MRSIALLAALVLVTGCGGKSQNSTSTTTNTMTNSMTSTASRTMKPRCKSGDPVVWVNTNSHVYHLQGSKYYGNTKEGKYECKTAADTEGDHQAKNESGAAMSGSTSKQRH